MLVYEFYPVDIITNSYVIKNTKPINPFPDRKAYESKPPPKYRSLFPLPGHPDRASKIPTLSQIPGGGGGGIARRSEAVLWELPPCPLSRPKWSCSRVHPYFAVALGICAACATSWAALHVLLQSVWDPGPGKPREAQAAWPAFIPRRCGVRLYTASEARLGLVSVRTFVVLIGLANLKRLFF